MFKMSAPNSSSPRVRTQRPCSATAEMAVALHRLTGISASRAGLYAKAPAGAIEDFLGPTAVI